MKFHVLLQMIVFFFALSMFTTCLFQLVYLLSPCLLVTL